MKKMKKPVYHFISHSHWDREWYKTFETFRLDLVDMINSLLNIFKTNPDYKHFTLDGQAVILEDYVDIMPDKIDELKNCIREGKILIGPWYILVDGSYIGTKGYSTSVTVNLGQTSWVDFTQQAPPLAEPFAIVTDDEGWISGISYADGEFQLLKGLADVGKNTRGVAVDDFDNDGHLDFVTGDGETSKLYIFLNDTTGRFRKEYIGTFVSSGWLMDKSIAEVIIGTVYTVTRLLWQTLVSCLIWV